MKISLFQFVKSYTDNLKDFKKLWKQLGEKDSETYPQKMELGDWIEKFEDFDVDEAEALVGKPQEEVTNAAAAAS